MFSWPQDQCQRLFALHVRTLAVVWICIVGNAFLFISLILFTFFSLLILLRRTGTEIPLTSVTDNDETFPCVDNVGFGPGVRS